MRRGAPEVVVVGSLNADLSVRVPRHPRPGETVLGGDVLRGAGGKGANQAVAAARLGRRVAMVGRVGDDDTGQQLRAALDGDGVDTSHVLTTPDTPTGMALITVDPDGENAIVVSAGANARLTPADVADAADVLAAAPVTLLQLEVPLETVTAAARSASGMVLVNPAPGRPLPAELLAATDVLVPNASELGVLAGADPPEGVKQAAGLARAVDGPGAVVVTLGAAGAVVVEGESTTHVPAVQVRAVDTTGAGDAFCAALADALAGGQALADAARWAVRVAAVSATRPGAQPSLPWRDQVGG